MASLADIWDTPAESVSRSDPVPIPVNHDDDDVPGSNPKRSSTRPRSTLFLDSDSDNDAPAANKSRYASKPGSSKPDIDAFWDDLDEDPGTAFKELAPSLDVNALKRQAEAEIALTPHQILPSSSPPRDTGDEDGEKDKTGKKKKDIGLKKRKRAILDEGRLVGPNGFPALVKQAKNFKPKGKGHEVSDLTRLLNVYQFWAHQMYPNTQFIDTVQRVEKLCHSKRLTVALGVWRDEAKGLINGHKIPDPEDPNDSDSDSDKDDDGARPTDVPVATEDERSSPAPSRGPSLPPSSASEAGGFNDDFDIDAMIAEDEAARAQDAATSVQSGSGSIAHASVSRPAANRTSNDEDEEMWDAVDDFPDEPFIPSHRPAATIKPAAPSTADEDEDMWDVVREMEADADARAKADGATSTTTATTRGEGDRASSPVTGPSGLVGVDPTRPASNDEGWDEMYA